MVFKRMRLAACLIAVSAACSVPVQAQAAAVSYENFDYAFYAQQNPDVQAAFGNDPVLLYQHYRNHGQAEGRQARFVVPQKTRISVFAMYDATGNLVSDHGYFNAAKYADDNPDVKAVFGYDAELLWAHYRDYGQYEGREAHGLTTRVETELKMFDIAASIFTEGMSEREKAQAAHDYIINNARYDKERYDAGTCPYISNQADGPIMTGLSLCRGYSEAFSYLMDIACIDNGIIYGKALNSRGELGGHAWNHVNVDGQLLYVDVTWDDPISPDGRDILRYDYFCIPYEQISLNHFASSYSRIDWDKWAQKNAVEINAGKVVPNK